MSQNPYASTSAPAGQFTSSHSPQGKYQFRSLKVLSILVSIFVGLTCLATLAMSSLDTFGYLTYPNYTDPNAEVGSDAEMHLITASALFGGVMTICYLIAAVVTSIFSYRSNANLHSLNVKGLEHTPGWCAGWWYVPIMSLFKPYQAVSETYNKSGDLAGVTPASITGTWWGFWIVGSIISNIEARLVVQGIDLGGGGIGLSWFTTILLCIAGILYIAIVSKITSNQHDYVDKNSRVGL